MTTRLTVAARSDVGQVRKLNEDAFLVADMVSGPKAADGGAVRFEVGTRGALLALADGMGGHAAGEVASAMTLTSLHRALGEAESTSPNPDTRVQGAVERANLDVFKAGNANPEQRKMGATLTAVLIESEVAHIAEIGDSRAYVLRGGAIRQVTRDQSLVQTMFEKGALTAAEAETSPMRNVLMQAMGQGPHVNVAVTSLALRQLDCLLLCSDGLWGKLTMEELRDVVLAAPSLDGACDRLVALANERGGEDNITVILAGVSGDMPSAAPGERISGTFLVLSSFDSLVFAKCDVVAFRESIPRPNGDQSRSRKKATVAGQACSAARRLAPSRPDCWRMKPWPAPS
jgi:serine/threonine protein phosphatase PrpC